MERALFAVECQEQTDLVIIHCQLAAQFEQSGIGLPGQDSRSELKQGQQHDQKFHTPLDKHEQQHKKYTNPGFSTLQSLFYFVIHKVMSQTG